MNKDFTNGNATFKITHSNGLVSNVTAQCPIWDVDDFVTSSTEAHFDRFLDFLPDEGVIELVSVWVS